MCSKEIDICSKNEFKCELCLADLNNNNVLYCQNCIQVMCSECRNSHEMESGCNFLTAEEIYAVQQSNGSVMKSCEAHSKPLKLICFDCNQLICRECIQNSHCSHKFEFVILASMKAKKELSEELKPLREIKAKLSDAIKHIQDREEELKSQHSYITGSVETVFQELHTELEKSQQQLLQEVNRKVESKLKTLKEQEITVHDASNDVSSVILQSEHLTETGTEDDLIYQRPIMTQQIQQAIQSYKKPIYPVEEADIAIKIECSEILQQVCKENIKITSLPVQLTVDRIPSTAEINSTFKVYLKCTLNNKPAKCPIPIEAFCKTLHNDFNVCCIVENTAHGDYCISHTPIYRGRHELTILYNSTPIQGSPFHIFVNIHPTKLQNPLKIWGRFDKPNGIAVNSKGEVIVAELKGDVIALNKNGQKLNVLKGTEHKFQQLRSIAVDSDDNIFFGDLASNCIFKANKEFSEVQVQHVTQLGEHGHRYIAVVGDEIMVCEKHNKGKITVYNKNLEFARTIIHEKGNEFCAVSSDSHGLLYVGSCGSPIIYVLDNEGKFIKTFQKEKSHLITPWSIFAFNSYVYIADTGTKSVVVLNNRGGYVTSFGHNLCSVCVDRDGFIYACNLIKGKVEIY